MDNLNQIFQINYYHREGTQWIVYYTVLLYRYAHREKLIICVAIMKYLLQAQDVQKVQKYFQNEVLFITLFC